MPCSTLGGNNRRNLETARLGGNFVANKQSMATLTGTNLVNFAAATCHSAAAFQKDIGIIGCQIVRSSEMEWEIWKQLS